MHSRDGRPDGCAVAACARLPPLAARFLSAGRRLGPSVVSRSFRPPSIGSLHSRSCAAWDWWPATGCSAPPGSLRRREQELNQGISSLSNLLSGRSGNIAYPTIPRTYLRGECNALGCCCRGQIRRCVMKKFLTAIALISLLTIPALESANAAPVSPSSSSFGSNGY